MTTLVSTVPPLSQSRFEKMACPHLYVEQEVRGHREPDNVYSLRGRQFHQGACDYTNHLVKTRRTSDVEWFRANILTREYLVDALEQLEFHGENFVIDPEKVLDSEIWLALDADLNPLEDVEPGNPLVCYEGTPDLITVPSLTALDIDDYKTFWRITDVDTFQSEFYPLLAFKHFPTVEEITFRLWFTRYGVKRERKFTRADVPKLEKRAREERRRQMALHALEAEPSEAMPGPHCAYCPKLQKGCPIAEINPYTNQTPEDRLKFSIWAGEALKENTRILKDLVDAQGPICIADANGKGYQAEFHLQHRGSYSATVLPVVSANAPELVERLTVGGLSNWLKAKKRIGLKTLCDAHRTEKAITKFTIHGVDLADDADESQSQAAD